MAITPQAIKDQEFQVKFRGFDALEVKDYLGTIADEFFELFEQVRQHDEEMERLEGEKQDLLDRLESLEKDNAALMEQNDRVTDDLAKSDERVVELGKELDDLKEQRSSWEEEKKALEEELDAAREQIAAQEERAENERKEKEKIGDLLAETEGKWAEQKSAEMDFKETLLAAQKFSREMRKDSEDEARRIKDQARKDAEKLRQETFEELARYPKEIERLRMRRNQVREDLRTVLSICLENLEIFDDGKDDDGEDLSELFQSVVVSDDGMIDREELSKLGMELDLLESLHTDEEGVAADGSTTDESSDAA